MSTFCIKYYFEAVFVRVIFMETILPCWSLLLSTTVLNDNVVVQHPSSKKWPVQAYIFSLTGGQWNLVEFLTGGGGFSMGTGEGTRSIDSDSGKPIIWSTRFVKMCIVHTSNFAHLRIYRINWEWCIDLKILGMIRNGSSIIPASMSSVWYS